MWMGSLGDGGGVFCRWGVSVRVVVVVGDDLARLSVSVSWLVVVVPVGLGPVQVATGRGAAAAAAVAGLQVAGSAGAAAGVAATADLGFRTSCIATVPPSSPAVLVPP